jgi:hypothetical protein
MQTVHPAFPASSALRKCPPKTRRERNTQTVASRFAILTLLCSFPQSAQLPGNSAVLLFSTRTAPPAYPSLCPFLPSYSPSTTPPPPARIWQPRLHLPYPRLPAFSSFSPLPSSTLLQIRHVLQHLRPLTVLCVYFLRPPLLYYSSRHPPSTTGARRHRGHNGPAVSLCRALRPTVAAAAQPGPGFDASRHWQQLSLGRLRR